MAKPVRVLHIVGAIYPGGMENFIMNLYRNIDREQLQFDIAVHARKENDYVEQIEKMGGRVYVLPRLTSNPIKSLKMLYRLVKENDYPVVIRHTSNALVAPQLLTARIAGAKTVCHSHTETDDMLILHKLGRLMMGVAATNKLACSDKAGKWMFGNSKFEIVHNAIDIDKFKYQQEKAQKIRDEFGLGNAKVYGHIGNFAPVKNHTFLLKIFKEISLLDNNVRFFCIGEGNLRKDIESEIQQLGLSDKVILTGIRKDVDCFMSCFDMLIFPSIFEGLPLTLIEAQAAGLPSLISDAITKDVIVTQNLVEMESIEGNASVWAQKAVAMAADTHKSRECQIESISKAGYNIDTLAKWYQSYLLGL